MKQTDPIPPIANNSEKVLEFYLPNNKKLWLTPITILLTSIFFSISIWFAISGNTNGMSFGSNGDETSNSSVEGISDFKMGEIKGTKETFTQYDNEVCEENGKPIVVMFSATWCPHCQWIGETFDKWASEQDNISVYRYEVDTGDNTLTDETEDEVPKEMMALYSKFNPSQSIPTFVFGCEYGRIGNGFEGEENGLELEVEAFDVIIEEITK